MIRIDVKAPKFSRSGLARLGAWFKDRIQKLSSDAYRAARSPQKRRALQQHTGRLFASITRIYRQRGNVIEAGVASSYKGAAALEYGGTIPARRLEAKGHALKFTIKGQVVYRQFAEIPAVTIPPHPFLRPSVRAAGRTLRSDVRAQLKQAVGAMMGRGT
jgi:hypothetical protein